eukprot:4253269-Prymnesium_polylepis.1
MFSPFRRGSKCEDAETVFFICPECDSQLQADLPRKKKVRTPYCFLCSGRPGGIFGAETCFGPSLQ